MEDFKMADWGFKVSREGYDVKTCNDKDLVMSSSFNLLKTKATGIASGTVAHGLSYIPIFFTTRKITVSGNDRWGLIGDDYATTCDGTNLNITSGKRYYIFYQQGA